MLAIALTLALHASPADFVPWRAFDGAFRNSLEAANFSTHVGWSLAVPLAGHAIDGRRGALIAGAAWLALALADEATHIGQNGYDVKERNLDLLSKLAPCALVMLWEALR